MRNLVFLALLAACGGGGGSAHNDADTVDGPATDDADVVDGTPGDASPDAPPFAGVAPARMVVSGAKRLHGAGTLVVDVEIGVLGN